MKHIIKASLLTLVLSCLFFSQIFSQETGWSKMKLGAGGWLTGMTIHPSGSPIFARSDVNNAWKWNESTGEWSPVITSSSMPSDRVDWHQYMGVLSIATAPSNNQVVYMAFYNTIFKSTNQGDTWASTNFPGSNDNTIATMRPNDDPSKLSGERLAVDPANQNVVYFGSINEGLYTTTNGGTNWSVVSTIPAGTAERGVRQVVFDPNSGTSSDRTNVIYVTVDGAGIYRTTNAGASWSNITSGSGFDSSVQFTDMEIAANGHIYVSAIGKGCRRYTGSAWENVSPPTGAQIMEVAVDPFDNDRVILKAQGNQPFYRTNNATSASPSWTSLSWDTPNSDVPWLSWEGLAWISEGEIMFDPAVQGRLWMAEGIGSWRTADIQDNNISWTGVSKGQEHMVNNDVIALPGGNVITAVWDRSIFVKNQSNLNEYADRYYPNVRFNSTWDLDVSPSNPNFVAAITEDHRYCCYDSEHRRSGYSLDAGLTWTEFGSMPEPNNQESIYGNIAVAANDINNMVWVPSFNKTPYYTTDRGNSWTAVNLPGNSGNCCMHAHYLQKEVLVADRVLPNTFYIYDWGNGIIFKSSDGGANWSAQGTVPAWAWHAKLRTVEGKAGHLLFAHGFRSDYASYNAIHGVYISTDGGQTWNEMSNTDKVNNVTTGKAAPGSNYPTIFIQGEVNGDFGYHASTDMGTNWTKIGTYPLGNFNYAKVMAGDPYIYGRLYVGPGSDGILYYDTSVSCPPVATTCDDGNPYTDNDTADGNCGCAGTCQPVNTPCDDSNPNTQNDVLDANCNCAGTLPSTDVCNAVTPPIIDGFGGEWSETSYALSNILLGTINSPSDLSATFQIQWDNNYLYVLGNVQDDNLINDSAAEYQDDGIEVFIDGGNEKGTTYDSNDHQLMFRVNDNDIHDYSGGQVNPAGVTFAQNATATGYTMEIRIAWSFIGVNPAGGMPLGIDIQVNDDDDGGDRDKKMSWNALIDQSWNDPSTFGTVTLNLCTVFSCATPVTVNPPGNNLAALVDTYPEGTCFYFPNGTYNFGNVYPKNEMKFTGESRIGVQINGNGFENAFHGVSSNVEIKNMTFYNFNNDAGQSLQEQAPIRGSNNIWANEGDPLADGWLIDNIESHSNIASGLFLGHNFTVTNSIFRNNGTTGIAGDDFLGGYIFNNIIYENGDSQAGGALVNGGGIKITKAGSPANPVIIEQNEVYDNTNVGIWGDVACHGFNVINNYIHDHVSHGILYEISDNAYIADNTLLNNTPNYSGLPGDWSRGGITIAESKDVLVENNTVTNSRGGIVVQQTYRPSGSFEETYFAQFDDLTLVCSDIIIQNNTINGASETGIGNSESGAGQLDNNSNIQYICNTYDNPNNMTFYWIDGQSLTYAQWQAAGRDNCVACPDDDNDGICNDLDVCPNFDDNLIGQSCDDGNPNTINDVYGNNCICTGTPIPTGDNLCNILTPPSIDGIGNEWSQTAHNITNALSGTISSPNDLSGTFQIQWDNNYLYLFGNIQDNNLINDSANIYQDDGIEVYIDGGNEKATTYDANDHQLMFRVNDNDVHYYSGGQINPAGVNFAQSTTGTGYAMEIRIAWSFIGVSPTDGMLIGIDVHVNDDDDGGDRDKKIAWHATIDQSWNNPSLFNTMELSLCNDVVGMACNTINNMTSLYASNLAATIQNNTALREEYIEAHLSLAELVLNSNESDPIRQDVFDCYVDLINSYPNYFKKGTVYDTNTENNLAWIRERIHRTVADALPLTTARKTLIANTLNLTGVYLEVWNDFDLLLADNSSLDQAQSDYIYTIFSLVPEQLINLGLLSFRDYLGDPPVANVGAIPTFLEGTNSGINTFSFIIGTAPENQFPGDISSGITDVFCAAAAHEINHIVEDFYVENNIAFNQRKDQLIQQAGIDNLNYLRSMFANDFFVNNPWEFIASIANQWFTDSKKTIELGLLRFDNGRPEPLNQALYFVDLYSLGSNQTIFYTNDENCNIASTNPEIGRDQNGKVNFICIDGTSYFFDLDASGNVINYSTNPFSCIDNNASVDLDICVLLEACYDSGTGLMRNTLETINLLPFTQSYNAPPWNYTGTETLDASGNVDWVLVSFRTGTGVESQIAQTAGLLQQDGCIYFPDDNVLSSDLNTPVYIVIEHRNHLVAMTPQPVNILNNTLVYDFRNGNSYAGAGGYGQKQLATGEWCLYAGDIGFGSLRSYDINGSDKSIWETTNGLFDDYLPADLDLNGDVNGNDKAAWAENNGVFSSVPK